MNKIVARGNGMIESILSIASVNSVPLRRSFVALHCPDSVLWRVGQ